MGFIQSHQCTVCGLAATVSGGDDWGFCAATQTRYCAKCETLVDVCTKVWSDDFEPGEVTEENIVKGAHAESNLGCCPVCGTPTTSVWIFGDPCPRCGGRIEKTNDEFIDWD